ncbi:hypothetical protein Cfor_02588, partial [Coptotermes formosanus]
INDDPRPGRPKISTYERSLKLIADFLEADRRVTCEGISQATGIPPKSVFRILRSDLQKRKICAPWVPHCLAAEQKPKRLDIATLMKQRFYVEGGAFLRRIVAVDETPDMSPPDLELFPKLKQAMRGQRFSSLEEFLQRLPELSEP